MEYKLFRPFYLQSFNYQIIFRVKKLILQNEKDLYFVKILAFVLLDETICNDKMTYEINKKFKSLTH